MHGVAHLAGVAAEARQIGHPAVVQHFALRDPPDDGIDPLVARGLAHGRIGGDPGTNRVQVSWVIGRRRKIR
jgi:hypothetical protein